VPESYKTVFDRALAEARELIERTRLSGSTSLSFASLAISELPSELAFLTDLTDLDLSGCRELTDLQPLAALPGLQSLNVAECDQVQDLQPLVALTSLQSLNLPTP
jgi:Leucine-rich repeat (LRR) protein